MVGSTEWNIISVELSAKIQMVPLTEASQQFLNTVIVEASGQSDMAQHLI